MAVTKFKKPRRLKMSKRSESGLDRSIIYWKRIKEDGNVYVPSRSCRNCDVCKLYYDTGCLSCPVFIKTNETHCNNTPYRLYVQYMYSNEAVRQKYAQKEIEFLQSCYY